MVAHRDLFLGKDEQPHGEKNQSDCTLNIRLTEMSSAKIFHDLVF